MSSFKLPANLSYNRGPIEDPEVYAKVSGCASWLCLTGEEFASMDGGISYDQIRAAVPFSANVISDPPRVLNLELARQHVAVLEELPRPTLITCRAGPRASAVAYLYAGLKADVETEALLAAAEAEDAPSCEVDEYREWVRTSLAHLRTESAEQS